jgi:hypothetical protein
MRSVIVFLREVTEPEVEAYLDAEYTSQRDPWLLRVPRGQFSL